MHQRSRLNTPERLDALRQRDHQAWEALYDEQWEPLCRFIQARFANHLNGHLDSEDMAQEVLCRAYIGIAHFHGEARIETWLKSIAQHVVIDALRMISLRHSLHDGLSTHEGIRETLSSQAAPDPETTVVRKDLHRKLLQEVVEVLGTYSGPFIKRYLAGMSEQEVADSEGLKRGTASGYLSRARYLLGQEQDRFTSLRQGEAPTTPKGSRLRGRRQRGHA
jgi:RNA polymerase sigma factor (sigma-70 family)